jgi:hypothetical protein
LNGIHFLPDRGRDDWPAERRLPISPDARPAQALDRALETITDRYGEATANVVAMQLEYPR